MTLKNSTLKKDHPNLVKETNISIVILLGCMKVMPGCRFLLYKEEKQLTKKRGGKEGRYGVRAFRGGIL